MTEQGGYPPPYAPPYQHPYQPYQPPYGGQAAMPGTVRAATIVTYVCSAVTVAMTGLMLLFAIFIGRFLLPQFSGSDRNELVLFVLGGVGLSIAASTLACWLAWQTGRRKGWARYGLAGCSGVAAVLSVLTLSPPTIVQLLGSVTVLVLLFVPESNAWFRDASADVAPATG